ncbi:unnamed protein product, partial [Discosporangium mesarthrocarpum]
MSVQLCRSSGFGGPGTFAVVFLHMFGKMIKLFGDDAVTNLGKDGYDEDDASSLHRPRALRGFRNSIDEEDIINAAFPPLGEAAEAAAAAAEAEEARRSGGAPVVLEADGASLGAGAGGPGVSLVDREAIEHRGRAGAGAGAGTVAQAGAGISWREGGDASANNWTLEGASGGLREEPGGQSRRGRDSGRAISSHTHSRLIREGAFPTVQASGRVGLVKQQGGLIEVEG